MAQDTPSGYPGILIRLRDAGESTHFPQLVKDALAEIDSKPVGGRLLKEITELESKKNWGYTVCIMRPRNLAVEDRNDGRGPQWSSGSVAKRANEDDARNGKGTVTAVTWNANAIETPDGSRPAFVALAHELIHALYNLKGEGYKDASEEEYRTVGLPPVANDRAVTENLIRAEHNLPHRASYGGLAPPSAPVGALA